MALLLPGQGSQHTRMAAGLYRHEAAFTEAMDAVFDALGPDGAQVRADWLSERPRVSIDHVTRSQMLLFAIDHAMGAQLRSWGVRPAALLGHSAGEMAAAVLAGAFDLTSASRVVWEMVNRIAEAPPGGMLAVAATAEDVAGYLAGDVVVGAVNAPRQIILAGPVEPLAKVGEALRADGFTCRTVPATTGFHSPMLDELSGAATTLFARLRVGTPYTTVYSGYLAKRVTGDDMADPALWAHYPASPVLFWPALDALLADGPYRLVEAGPGQRLASVARRHPAVTRGTSHVFAALPARPRGGQADRESLRELAELLVD